MFILKLLLKIILLPVFLMICFIRSWVDVLSKIGCVILGLFYMFMFMVIIMYVRMKMWDAVGIAAALSFAGFLVTFAAVAVGVALEGITDKLSKILAS